jgi:hypothetical protein
MSAAMSTNPSKPWSKRDDERLRAMLRGGFSREWIAKTLGRSKDGVKRRMSVIGMADRADQNLSYGDPVEVPSWVPKHLHDEYDAVAFEEGEEAAARWARAEIGLKYEVVQIYRKPAPQPVTHVHDPSHREILKRVCWLHGVDAADVLGRTKVASVTLARQHFAWLLRRHTKLTSMAVGQILGRDHSTILHSEARIDREIKARRKLWEAKP